MGFNVKISQMLSIFALLLLSSRLVRAANDADFSVSLGSFSQRLFTELYTANPKTNLIYSPFSIQSCMAMTRMGAGGNTAVEMDQGLGFTGQTPESVANNYHTLLAKYEDGKTLKVANKVYVMKDHELQNNYREALAQKFFSTPENLDFEKAKEAAQTINTWVETKTNNKIKDLMSADVLGADTRLVLVSAIHFKGEWQTKFPQDYTKEREFFLDETKSVNVSTMITNGHFVHADLDNLASKAVLMPYKDSGLSMLIILPDSRTGLSALEEKLRTVSFTSLKSRFLSKPTKVEIRLPKFEAEFKLELKDTLIKMGMQEMFGRADFSKMLKSPEPLYISSAVHKTFISVNEFGTEAAGATSIEASTRSLPEFFIAEHPFYYAIVDADFVPLFQGTIVNF